MPGSEPLHVVGKVASSRGLHQEVAVVRRDQADRVTWNSQSDLDFRAHGPILDVGLEGLDEVESNAGAVVAAGLELEALADHQDRFGEFPGGSARWRGGSAHGAEYSLMYRRTRYLRAVLAELM